LVFYPSITTFLAIKHVAKESVPWSIYIISVLSMAASAEALLHAMTVKVIKFK
jgi:hypothetical protein